MPILSGRLASIVVLACLLAGCQPAAPVPTPVPSYRCTPEAGGPEFDCTQHQYDDMLAKDKLYAEAEAVYRKFLAEDIRIFRAGGVTEPTAVLLETTTGAFLEDSMALYSSLKADSRRLVGGEIKLTYLGRKPGVMKEASVVAMVACVDARTTEVREKGKRVSAGQLVEDLLYFGLFNGQVKIQGADGQREGECDGS